MRSDTAAPRHADTGTSTEFRTEQLRLLLENSPSAALINLAIAGLAFAAIPTPYTAWVWGIVFAATLRLVLWAVERCKGYPPVQQPWLFRTVFLAVGCQGAAWGFASVQLFLGSGDLYRFYVIAIVCGMTGGSALFLSPSIPCFAAFALPATVPLVALLLTSGDPTHFHAGLMGIVFIAAVHGAAWRVHRAFREQVELRVVQQRTAADLRWHQNNLESVIRERTENLELAKESYRSLIEEINDVIFELDRNGIITYMSPVVERLCGRKSTDFEGRPFTEFIYPEDLPTVRDSFVDVLEGELFPSDYRIIDHEGKPHWVRSSSRPALKGVEVVGIRGVVSDLEEVKRGEEERRRLEERFHQKRKLEAVGTLAGGIAHEFNNILATVLGYAELGLLRGDSSGGDTKGYQEIRAAAVRGRDIVRQILSFSRPRVNRTGSHDASALVTEGLRTLRDSFPKSVQLVEDIAPGVGNILVDPAQFQLLLKNLCTNACQSLKDGVGAVEVSLGAEDVGTVAGEAQPTAPGPQVVLKVRDTGEGMDEETAGRVFEPFFTHKQASGRTGLGLSVVHGIVEAHRGTITVASTPGTGTTFTVRFPMAGGEPIQATPPPPPPDLGAGSTVLFLDDEPALVKLACAQLEGMGFVPRGFTKPAEALASLRAAPDSVDLVITDLTMPEMDGLQFAEAAVGIRPGLPILLHTGHLETPAGVGELPACIHGVLNKPLQRSELAAAVVATLARPTESA